jgi:WD40 repeat protein
MKVQTILAAAAAVLLSTAAAQAAQVAALWGDNTISIVDTTAKKVVKTWKIQGVAGKVLGIDVRPADGMLYAVGADGGIYTVDTATGKATMKSKLDTMLPAGSWATVDFNPVADRMRLIGSDGTNLRVNVDDGKVTTDGKLKFADADANKGKTPKVIAGAYINSVKGAKETALFDIDATTWSLVKQAPPNDGILNTVGMHGVKGDVVAFDIWSDGQGKNDAWLFAGDWFYSVDLGTGKATPSVQIKGVSGVRDIAILPAAPMKSM